MKQALVVLLLISLAGTLASAQQTPTAAPARQLTPAEQRQKEKIEREVQRERQIRAEWAQKQREYEARQAEKERQRQAKKAEKERGQQDREESKSKPAAAPAPTPSVAAPVNPAPASEPAIAEPKQSEKREKRRKDPVSEPTPAVPPADVQPVTPSASVEPPAKAARPERPKRVRKPVNPPADSLAGSSAGTESAIIRPRGEFLPKGHLFEPIILDPLEAQTYGSVLPLYYTEGQKYAGSIVPFAFGFAKPFYRRTKDPGHSEEWVLDLASFTQFEAYHDYQLNKARRQIVNNDYKVSIIYNVRRGINNYRFRIYHLSSHLGDDYIYRNRITAPTPNSVNYEVVDATYSRVVRDWRLYGGIGFCLRKAEERKLLSAQLGAFYKKPSDKAARLVGGVDIKFWQQTDFRPGIHAGVGVEVGRTTNNLTFLVEGYSGFRPYSQFENQQTTWMGIGVYLNPF